MDTLEWSLEEVGAYTRLLLYEWDNGSLPTDTKKLAQVAGTTPKRFQKVSKTILKKFIVNEENRYINLRLETVRQRQLEYKQKQAQSGLAGARKRWKKDGYPNGNPNGDPISKPNDQNMAFHISDINISSTNVDDSQVETPDSPPKKNAKVQIPPCPHKEIVDLYHEILPELPKVVSWTDQRQAFLRGRWKDHHDLAWWREFFIRVSKSNFLTGRAPSKDDKPPFMADLEWLIRPSNFVKILEGKYDNRNHVSASSPQKKILTPEEARRLREE